MDGRTKPCNKEDEVLPPGKGDHIRVELEHEGDYPQVDEPVYISFYYNGKLVSLLFVHLLGHWQSLSSCPDGCPELCP